MKLTLTDQPDPAVSKAIEDGLDDYNAACYGRSVEVPVQITLRDEAGQLVAGLNGKSYQGWMKVVWLWVRETHRGTGLGTQLMQAAEEEARKRGCAGMHLTTYEKQGPGFYKKMGFESCGRIEGYPPGSYFEIFKKPFE